MALPELFIKQIEQLLPPNEAAHLIAALDGSEPSVSVRLNARKCKKSTLSGTVPWCNLGYYLQDRPQFTFDPLLHAGCYYVQDASSMFIAYAIQRLTDNSASLRYLDLCAAPGGKTTAAIDSLPEGSLVVANEIMPGRARILQENIIKWGNPRCVVTNNDSAAFSKLTHFFDIVAADVPCSGEGMMRKDSEAVAQWTPALVNECATRQIEIINNAWQALRPGGLFIYSTCTFNRNENEDIARYLIDNLGAESVDLAPPAEWHIHPALDSTLHGYRFFPHRTQGEGLFLTVVRKPHTEPRHILTLAGKQKSGKKSSSTIPHTVKEWLAEPDGMTLTAVGDTIVATPAEYSDEIAFLRENLKVIYHGCDIAVQKGKDFIPAHALASSTCLNTHAFHACPVDYATAIAYLRGETVTIDAPRGCVLLKYHDRPLGFVKNLGNRANNLYPKEWRIKSTHLPSEPPLLLGSLPLQA